MIVFTISLMGTRFTTLLVFAIQHYSIKLARWLIFWFSILVIDFILLLIFHNG